MAMDRTSRGGELLEYLVDQAGIRISKAPFPVKLKGGSYGTVYRSASLGRSQVIRRIPFKLM